MVVSLKGAEFLHAVAAYLANTEARACAISIAFAAVKVVAVVVKCLGGAVCQMTSNVHCEKHVVLMCADENFTKTCALSSDVATRKFLNVVPFPRSAMNT